MDGASTIATRPFGAHVADLEIDFADPDRPALVTALLAACLPPHDGAHWWACGVGARQRALLTMLQAMGTPMPAQQRTCPACGERLEFELPLDELTALQADEAPLEIGVEGRSLRLRLPTGRDLHAWQADKGRPPAAMDVLRSLVVEGEVHDDDIGPAARALAQADPLVAFSVQLACPDCCESAEYEVDLESLALGALASRQRELIDDVHRFASRYGWSEAQVLAVPAWRRAHYRALIEAAS